MFCLFCAHSQVQTLLLFAEETLANTKNLCF